MIQVTNIHKAFGGNQVLKGIDLTIEKGKVVVILGPSGSGKTTFLRCLNALEIPDQGIIAFDDGSLTVDFATKPKKKHCSRCSVNQAWYFNLITCFHIRLRLRT